MGFNSLRQGFYAALLGTVLMLTGCGGSSPSAPGNSSTFEIDLNFASSLSSSQKAAFEGAAGRWSQVITAGLPSLTVSGNNQVCLGGLSPFNGPVNSLRIDVVVKAIDGPGKILGSSGPCLIRKSSGLPAYGVMQFDSADLNNLESEGLLVATVTHEMGHVLGYGTLWGDFHLATGVGDGAHCGGKPRYVGVNAVREWKSLGGTGNIPLEKGSSSADLGTCDSHWRESVFGKELMTGYIDAGSNPLSRVTVGALDDLGYTVSYDAADPYSLPTAPSAQSAGQPLKTRLIFPSGTVDDR